MPRRRPRRRLWLALAVGLLVAGAVAAFVAVPGPAPDPKAAPAVARPHQASGSAGSAGAADPAPKASGAPPKVGVYTGPGNLSGAEAFASALGSPVTYALDYVDGSSWEKMAGAVWVTQQWSGTPFQMILGVPMLPPDGSTLQAGAAGAYDGYFTEMAQNLVQEGYGSAVLMLGWDADLAGNPWSVSTPAEATAYVSYWHRIVAAMRSVPGTSFKFMWDGTSAQSEAVTPAQVYPGPADVDIVATDIFDQAPQGVPPSERFATILERPFGPDWYAQLAKSENKPFMVAKLAVVPTAIGGGGDDPTFVADAWAWAVSRQAAAVIVWDQGALAISGGAYPKSFAALRYVVATAAADAS